MSHTTSLSLSSFQAGTPLQKWTFHTALYRTIKKTKLFLKWTHVRISIITNFRPFQKLSADFPKWLLSLERRRSTYNSSSFIYCLPIHRIFDCLPNLCDINTIVTSFIIFVFLLNGNSRLTSHYPHGLIFRVDVIMVFRSELSVSSCMHLSFGLSWVHILQSTLNTNYEMLIISP